MYMGGVSRKKYAPSAIRRRLTRSVCVAGGDLHRLELHFCPGDMLQHPLKILESDFRGAIEAAPIEIDDTDATRGWPMRIQTARRKIETRCQTREILEFDGRHIAGKFRLSALKLKARQPADAAATAIAANQPSCVKVTVACLYGDAISGLTQARNLLAHMNLDA
jgi:hypothetical protein